MRYLFCGFLALAILCPAPSDGAPNLSKENSGTKWALFGLGHKNRAGSAQKAKNATKGSKRAPKAKKSRH